MRKHIRPLIAFIALLIFAFFFGKPVFLKTVGGVTKAYLKYAKNITFQYSDLAWDHETLVFENARIEHPRISGSIPRLFVHLSSKEIEVFHPQIAVDSLSEKVDASTLARESKNPFKSSLDLFDSGFSSFFSIKVVDGEIKLGNQKGDFTFFAASNKTSLEIFDGSSTLCINQRISGKKTTLSIISHEFPIDFLGFCEGAITSELFLEKEDSIWTVTQGLLDGEKVSFQHLIENLSGSISFAGPIYGYDLYDTLERTKFRLSIEEGVCPLGSDLRGDLSFDGRAGLKWDFSFLDSHGQMQSSGKGFFHSLEGRWIDSYFASNTSDLSLFLRDSVDAYQLSIAADNVQKDFLGWVQNAARSFGFADFGWNVEKGTLSGLAHLSINKNCGITWNIEHCHFEDLAIHGNDLHIACEKGVVKEGAYAFSGGSFTLSDGVFGKNWKGKGDISTFLGSLSGELGALSLEANYRGNFDLLFASLKLQGIVDGEMSLQGALVDSGFQFALRDGGGTLLSTYKIENFRLDGEATRQGISLYDVKGIVDAGKKVPFYAPIVQTNGAFDLRFEKPLFDIARFVGTSKAGQIHLDQKRCHILGNPVKKGKGSIKKGKIEGLEVTCDIPWKTFPVFFEAPAFFQDIGDQDVLSLALSYDQEISLKLTSQITASEKKIDIDLNMLKANGKWRLRPSTVWNWEVEADFLFEKEGIQITRATGKSSDGIDTAFSGRIHSLDSWDLKLSHFFVDLSDLSLANELQVQGILEGEGMLHWKGGFDSDFDLTASNLKMKGIEVTCEAPLNLSGSSKNGLLIRGLSLSTNHLGDPSRCKIGLFQYTPRDGLATFTDADFDLPSNFLRGFGFEREMPAIATDFIKQPLRGIADLTLKTDLSALQLSMQQVDVLFEDKPYCLQNLRFDLKHKHSQLNFDLAESKRTLPIDVSFDFDPLIKGRLTVENGLKVDWVYRDELILEAIEGKCSGVEASFQKETDSLIGRARINGNEFKNFLPEKISNIFNDLKIGDGYELMGRLAIKDRNLCFRGLLSGKQIELFGFEFKNILGRIEWDANHLLVSDLKVSDFAGVMKVDEIRAQVEGDGPWTLSIPHIIVTELRPSLLQGIGGAPGEISPLVVRQLRIDDFKGIAQDRNTYTAKGELFFINSYKRGTSLLELPSDFLSRIVGLDFDLLVPVCGTLKYELQDGFFNFTELKGSYSENKRSEFFLSFDEKAPKMDLDWNLNILIEMKQFVLFKFTEAFMISVTGKLDDPKFNLQRKKRLFGVL